MVSMYVFLFTVLHKYPSRRNSCKLYHRILPNYYRKFQGILKLLRISH
jgi:hypothetical protein